MLRTWAAIHLIDGIFVCVLDVGVIDFFFLGLRKGISYTSIDTLTFEVEL